MEFISFTSVITNAAIIAFSSLWIKQNLFIKYLHANSDEELLAAQLGFILVFEHVVFLFKIILRAAIPNVPLTIKLAVQRSKYMSRVANEGLNSEMNYDYEDYSLSQTDESDSQSEGDDDDGDEMVPRTGSSLWRAHTHLGIGVTRAKTCGEVDDQAASTGAKLNSRPGLVMVHSWSSRVLQFGGSSSMRNKSKKKGQKRVNDAGLRGKDSEATMSAAMAGALPKIQEIPPSVRSGSVAGNNGAGIGPGTEGWRLSEEFNLRVPERYEVGSMPQQHRQEMMHHRSPLAQSPVVGIDRPLYPSQSLGNQRRPPVPQRANTEMDGDWVVLEEKGV